VADISNRKFGIEIECFGVDRTAVATAITTAGITCYTQRYNHSTARFWKIVDDGSVSDGFELVSPPLQGVNGLKEVEIVLNILCNLGVKVDNRCGFHVHVDAEGLTAKDLVNIVKRYQKFEQKIDSIMPQARRGNNNDYCRSMTNFLARYQNLSRVIERSDNPYDVTRYIGDRYYKVNLAAYERHRTVEFRQHSGTVSAAKAINWIIFCITLVNTTIGTSDPQSENDIILTKNAGVRLKKMISMLEEGSTIERVAEETGWKPSTVKQYLTRKLPKMGYYIRILQAGVIKIVAGRNAGKVIIVPRGQGRDQIQSNTVNLDPFSELDMSVRNYFAERAVDFGFVL
jgi:hypothetical protein